MKKLAVPLIVVVFAAAACLSLSGGDELADMEIRAQAGTVSIQRGDETIEVPNEPVPLETQDVVTTGRRGFAILALEDDRVVKLQPNAEITIDSTQSLESERGNVLVHAAARTTVQFEGVRAAADRGARFRVDSGFGSTRVGSYSGRIGLTSPGQSPLNVPTLFQATVAAGDLPGRTEPYDLDQKDAWDLDLLEEVVQLEDELGLLAKGFTRQLRNNRPNLAYFRALADGRNVSFMSDYLRRRPIDLLIGFTVADNSQLQLKSAFRKAFGLYDDGATWGVTATIMDVSPGPIVAQLEDLIVGTGAIAADGESDEPEFTVAAAEAGEEGRTPEGSDSGDQPADAGGEDTRPSEDDDGKKDDDEKPKEDEECEPGDVGCEIGRVFPTPSESPSSVMDGAINVGDGKDKDVSDYTAASEEEEGLLSPITAIVAAIGDLIV